MSAALYFFTCLDGDTWLQSTNPPSASTISPLASTNPPPAFANPPPASANPSPAFTNPSLDMVAKEVGGDGKGSRSTKELPDLQADMLFESGPLLEDSTEAHHKEDLKEDEDLEVAEASGSGTDGMRVPEVSEDLEASGSFWRPLEDKKKELAEAIASVQTASEVYLEEGMEAVTEAGEDDGGWHSGMDEEKEVVGLNSQGGHLVADNSEADSGSFIRAVRRGDLNFLM